MITKKVEALVKLRDAYAMASEALNEYIETLAPPEVKETPHDFSKLVWEKKQGKKGEYEQTSEKANQNNSLWQQLKAELKEHNGFWQNNGYKYWFHRSNAAIIDRRKI